MGVNKVYDKATVERVWWSRKPAVRITTEDGGSIVASTDHVFLKPPRGWFKVGNARVLQSRLRRIAFAEPANGMSDDYCAGYLVGATDGDGTMRERVGGRPYREEQWYWRVAVSFRQTEFIDRLIECAARFGVTLVQKPFNSGHDSTMIKVETRKSDAIATLSQLWGRSGTDFSLGYLGGIFDAEGSFGKSGGTRPNSLRIANTNEAYLDGIIAHGKVLGFRFKIENFHGRHCKTARLYGSLDELGRFIGSVRPALSYKKEGAFGCRIEGRTPRVVAVEYVGERDLVDIQTTKRTFVANGYLTHNCYAVRDAQRMGSNPNPKIGGVYGGLTQRLGNGLLDWTDVIRTVPERLEVPLRWRRGRRIFVNSQSDLFHKDVPFDFIERVFDVMRRAHWHQFQVLTKRAERLEELAPRLPWPDNVWQGVSVENANYTFRIDHLRRTGAKIKFLSVEPLLGPIPNLDLTGIDWVIVGGESGPGARPLRAEWVREILDQCRAAGASFFFKQAGAVLGRELGCADGKGGDAEAWPRELRVRELPVVAGDAEPDERP